LIADRVALRAIEDGVDAALKDHASVCVQRAPVSE
jgi:hypothetical protein